MPKPAVVLLILLTACRAPAPPQAEAPFSERRLAVLPDGTELQVPPAFARDGSAVAFVAHTKENDWVVHGSWVSPRFSLV